MHTVMEVETSVPAFLGKLWKLVEDPETDDLICWAPNGRSFFIRNPAQFARELLPHYYKHNNMASFVRQLNMYGFHKKVSVELGGLKCERDEMEFAHQYFIKDHPYLLEHIKRKIASSKTQDGHPPIKAEVMNKVLSEVRSMRGRQEHMDSRLGAMKRENEALWRELAMLRRKHLKQQEIVNKLIHFLVTLVQPSRSGGLSVKRRYPLMIDDHQRNKQMKVDKLVPEASPTGPVIHELDASEHEHHVDDLDSEYIVAEMLENHHPSVQSPESIVGLDDEHIETVHFSQNTTGKNDHPESQETSSKIKVALKPKKKEEMDNHLEAMHNDLENLREMLRSEGYTIDANTLMELFGNNDPMSFGIPVNPELNPTHEKDDEDPIGANGATGGELMAYTPSNLLDFDDDMFLNTNNLGTECTDTQNSTNEFYNQESLDLEDSKSLLLDSLVSGNGNSSANL